MKKNLLPSRRLPGLPRKDIKKFIGLRLLPVQLQAADLDGTLLIFPGSLIGHGDAYKRRLPELVGYGGNGYRSLDFDAGRKAYASARLRADLRALGVVYVALRIVHVARLGADVHGLCRIHQGEH